MPEPDRENVLSGIESVLFLAGGPVSVADLAAVVGEPRPVVQAALCQLQARMRGGIRLQIDRDRAQMVTAPDNAEIVQRFLGTARPAPLSRPAVETLAVVAYRQPVTRAEVEAARGVNSDRAMQTLLGRGLIEEAGHRNVLGHPLQYATTFEFLEYFGLDSLADLPPLPEPADVQAGVLGLRGVQNSEGGPA